MKQFLALLLLISFSGFSQDTIFLKNGTKIIPRAGVHKYYGTPLTKIDDGKRLSYAVPNSSWGKSVKSKDLDYAVVADRLIKVFELKYKDKDKQKISEPLAYYVLIETEQYRLITVTYSKDLIVPIVHNFIIDKDDTIVEGAHYVTGGTKNDVIARQKVADMIKKYFSQIKEEMDFLEECRLRHIYDDYSGISEYLKTHSYKKYN